MDRRFATVLGVSLVFALVVSSIFYQMTARAGAPAKALEQPDLKDIVVAAKPLTINLLSSKPNRVRVPPTVVVPVGHDSAAFDLVQSGAVDSPEFAPLKVQVIERFGKLFDIVGSG